MSEHKKRLDELAMLSAYDANHPEAHPYGRTLKADHLQAREDVRRLAALLRLAVALLDGKIEPSVRAVDDAAEQDIENVATQARAALSEVES